MAILSGSPFMRRFIQFALVAASFSGIVYFLAPATVFSRFREPPTAYTLPPKADHPIDFLTLEADRKLDRLLSDETSNVHDAAEAYRQRRGRQPPPGFGAWHAFAQNKSALIIEDFFDRIYHDLNPFWGVPAKQIRDQANGFKPRISIRNHTTSQHGKPFIWIDLWEDLIGTIAEYLPDLDLPINMKDESRMIVPWEDIDRYMQSSEDGKRVVAQSELKDTFQSLDYLDEHPPEHFAYAFGQGTVWKRVAAGCPPDGPARQAPVETDFTSPPVLDGFYPKGSYDGYVRNWTLAKSTCDNAHLQGLHGSFIHPISFTMTNEFFPLFGGSKLSVNNEILLPAAMYWSDIPIYTGGKNHGDAWKLKKDGMTWRGSASGGINNKDNWTRFQRHRFVSMVNATSVHLAETGSKDAPPDFVLPANNSYDLAARNAGNPGDLSAWIRPWSDVAFVGLFCHPKTKVKHGADCPYTVPYFSVRPKVTMEEQYDYKYLPDIDGNSFSGRYRGFLGSTSLPIKATIYEEWHDSRLVPWKHFVPMDNTFIDIYGIMEYFLGNAEAGVGGHDDVAMDIAIGGKLWAERVLRKEDMQIYVLRLLLEFARLCDDERDIMGWRDTRSAADSST